MTGSANISAAAAAAAALEATNRGESVALVTVIAGPEPGAAGKRLIVTSDSVRGGLGSSEADARAVDLARESLESRWRGLRSLEVGDATWEIYVESQHPRPELVIIGAGHIARPLARIGSLIGFRVTVLDDRPEFASERWFPDADKVAVVDFAHPFRDVDVRPDSYIVLVTRAHEYDYDCIRELLSMSARPAYLGMIGSRRRVRAAFEALVSDGIDPRLLDDVRAPIGLDIAAETPEEIAVAIAAEIIAGRRGGSGVPLTESERVLRRVARKHESKKGAG